jgi:hypothetical protein
MKIAIQGHRTRGYEVLQILESLGGKKRADLTGRLFTQYYFINYNGDIDLNLKVNLLDYKFYTVEEFEKEFPFKIGDKVTIIGIPDFPKTITKMEWDRDEILYSFEGLVNTWFGAKALKKFEMKEERNITLTLDKAKEWYKKGGELREIALQAFGEKELNPLPKSWEEFCEKYPVKDKEAHIDSVSNIIIQRGDATLRSSTRDRNICPSKESAEAHLAMIQLEQLRNCWWGDWEPEYNCGTKYIIKWDKDDLIVTTSGRIRAFLIFPTKEMAEEFLECFRDLIEKAGDLI